MSKLIRIQPHMYLATPLGYAEAHFLWAADNNEQNVQWGCFQTETKENWWWPSPVIRICESISEMRDGTCSDIHISDNYFETLREHIRRHTKSPFFARAMTQ